MFFLLLPLVPAAAVSLFSGCSNNDENPKTEPKNNRQSKEDRMNELHQENTLIQRERTELAGDQTLGKLYYLRQLHRGSAARFQAQRLFIGRYQYEMLRFLEEKKVNHLFSEALEQDMSGDSLEEYCRKGAGDRFEESMRYFIGDLKSEPSEQQLLIAYQFGADLLYGLRNKNAVLHMTATHEELRQDFQITEQAHGDLAKINKIISENLEFVDGVRESWATREIISFLKSNPGETAALIYGIAHGFCDDFKESNFPLTIEGVWWEAQSDKLSKLYGLTENDFPGACINNPE